MASSKPKDRWEKADIVLKALLPVAVAAVGYFGTSYLSDRQHAESTKQFYTDLLARREESDSNLRKEMFRYVIDNFLGNPQADPVKMVVGLEMLALNFHDSFDLSPLFKDVHAALQKMQNAESTKALRTRLIDISKEIADRQAASLADVDHRWDTEISDFAETLAPNFGSKLLLKRDLKPLSEPTTSGRQSTVNLTLEVLAVDTIQQTAQLRLEVRRADAPQPVVERAFWLSYFDFPALNNVRLPNRERVAVALRRFDGNSAQLQVLHFPETRASLKEKPYFDDLIFEMKHRAD
ncbi:hypothetical protein [Piscinibacter sp. XHJ-5]|uniref:hypothetical protein n=1 Tax=Piscinibacter sp. XHJ-5 TaxID=3037797 RepID=UPI0024530C8A|nr:hypothetical protein [Piscinibacter sp. XHJ-5]